MMLGTIRSRDGKLYVVHVTTESDKPVRVILWWEIVSVFRDPYSNRAPVDGDAVEYRGNGAWAAISPGSGGSAKTGDGTTDAVFVEKVDVPPPAARGKELRWHYGRWEKLLAKGWVPAGDGWVKPRKARQST